MPATKYIIVKGAKCLALREVYEGKILCTEYIDSEGNKGLYINPTYVEDNENDECH